MTRKHDALIREWMDGRSMQYKDGDIWMDMEQYETCRKMPHWYIDGEYRPKPVTYRYKTYAKADGSLHVVSSLEEETAVIRAGLAAKWLDDWKEVTL